MTLSQSKPGLVLVALEEMPNEEEGRDPNQGEVGRLISMRFSGRKGEFREGAKAPRNSAKRGESGSLVRKDEMCSDYSDACNVLSIYIITVGPGLHTLCMSGKKL